ncbi:MAG: bifunctional [glutamine synthetase] adenylyltransferase/[glutamine synthetase]-adenylyl-L-tyrosine phosphorylase [Corynebacterium sp.]|nr:bifunctional [glutamine synthetase] adenylyltransferase/[glutamine synthetase]-adenylyl-L-tyrosine phosphorylase [Corynebacterium sp.]
MNPLGNTARTSRNRTGTGLSGLGLAGPHAQQDLADLGWVDQTDILWGLAGAGNPDMALNQFVRLKQALEYQAENQDSDSGAATEINEKNNYAALDHKMRTDKELRIRLFAVLGGSSALGDFLVAHPHLWPSLDLALPTQTEMMRTMLAAVDAKPAQFSSISPEDTAQSSTEGADVEHTALTTDTASADLSTPGTYVAGFDGREADVKLIDAYKALLLRIAAHDLAGTYISMPGHVSNEQPAVPFPQVAGALTSLADAALNASLAVAMRTVYGDNPAGSHLAILAMGKCGARELNYISDVDVIFVGSDAESKITRVASEFIRVGSRCFFDVDAALRPEGKHGALVRTEESHMAYYKKWAHTWEFQAQLKARPMAGDMALAQQHVDNLQPLVWTASQREDFVPDVQAMRARVVENVPKDLRARELKLGHGGLRDVEFAVQMLQLVHGRSDENLRVTATTEALTRLIDGGYVGREDGAQLIKSYEFLRLLEHRLQLQRLKRTHLLPADDDTDNLRWLARAAGVVPNGGESYVDAIKNAVRKTAISVRDLHTKLFFRPLLNSVVNLSVDQLRLTPEAAKRQLAALNYAYPDRAYEHLVALASGTRRRAKIQAMLLPTLLGWLSQTYDPDAGLLNYRKLSETAGDSQWYLRMLRDEGVVGQRLMQLLGTSPYVSDLILGNPETVQLLGDGATGPKLLDVSPETVSTSLVAAASRQTDPDKAIAVARSLRRAELARVASADLLGLLNVVEVAESLSRVWCAVLEAALRAEIKACDEQLARICVIGMGRLGGMELGYASDADVMFVCEPTEGVDNDTAIKWSIGVVDRLRKRLAKPSGDPPLELDLGLRPEGRSGAAVRTVESYKQYYERWGEPWELQALLRAVPVAGDMEVGQAFLDVINPLRYPEGGCSEETSREIKRMKARVDNERLPRGADKKTHTKLGRGGLGDVEWTVQLLQMQHPEVRETGTLQALTHLEEISALTMEQARQLRESWLLATKSRNALALVRRKWTDQLPEPGSQLAPVAKAAGWEDYQAFYDHYLKVTRRARGVVDEVFWGERLRYT